MTVQFGLFPGKGATKYLFVKANARKKEILFHMPDHWRSTAIENQTHSELGYDLIQGS